MALAKGVFISLRVGMAMEFAENAAATATLPIAAKLGLLGSS